MAGGSGAFGPVRLAWTDVSHADPVPIDSLHAFGEQQVRRYASLTGVAARRFLVGRSVLAGLLGDMTDEPDLTMITTCPRCGGDHGQPRLERAPVAVSVSYAGSMVAVAAVRHADAWTVGVDIERAPSEGTGEPLRDLAALFAPARTPDLQEWTLIEAALKADGRGLLLDLSEIEVVAAQPGSLTGARAVRIPGRSDAIPASMIPGPAEFVLSAAMVPAVGAPR